MPFLLFAIKAFFNGLKILIILVCFLSSWYNLLIMLNKKKIYIILFSLIVLICLSGFIWSFVVTKDIRKSQKTEKGAEKNQVVSVKNLVLTETKEEEIYWELYAAKGSYDSSTGAVILDEATGNFYNTENEVVLSFKSDIGTYDEETKKITLRGNTLVVAHDGSSIRADQIVFKGKDEDIVAKGHVVVSRNEDFVSFANEARFNSELTFFEIKGKTQTNVYSDDEVKPQELTN